MVMTPEDYKKQLWSIQNDNFPKKAIFPYVKEVYNIDMKTRKIDSPQFLSILKDHKAESVYFSVPRYVDYMDLAETACIIQYKLKDGTYGIYPVQYYDITTLNEYGNERIIISWLLDGKATSLTGPVEYSFKFFRIDDAGSKFLYNLNTLPATSQVLYGLDIIGGDYNGDFDILPTEYEKIIAKIAQIQKDDLYWIEIK